MTIIYTDGGGKSAYCGGKATAVITSDGTSDTIEEVLYREYKEEMTCNTAEYTAVLLALEERPSNEKIILKTDSQLVVNQMIKGWKINFDHLKFLNDCVRGLINTLQLDVEFQYVPRDKNLAGLFNEGKLMVDINKIRKENH